MNAVLSLLALLGLLLVNAFFVVAEYSLVSVRRSRIDTLVEEGDRRAAVVRTALRHLSGYIAATQLGVTIASIALGWVGEPAVATLLDPLFERILPESLLGAAATTVSVILAFILVTFFTVVFGELVPKSVALQYTERTAMLTAGLVGWFLALFRPIIWLMNTTGRAFLGLFGIRPSQERGLTYSEEELRLIVEASTKGGELVESEEEIIRRAFSFHDWAADDIMVPRTELVALPVAAPVDEILTTIATTKYARYPVYGDNLDDILGVLYVKDLVPALARLKGGQTLQIRPLIRPVLNVPASLRIDEVLEQMKLRSTHVAVAIDEYGGTAGMLTLDDIMERVVGDVPDEFERPQPEIVDEPDGSAHVNGLTALAGVNEHFGLEIEADDTNTIGGYVFSRLGHRPEVGDVIRASPYEIRIDAMDGLRVAQLTFVPIPQPVAPDQGGT